MKPLVPLDLSSLAQLREALSSLISCRLFPYDAVISMKGLGGNPLKLLIIGENADSARNLCAHAENPKSPPSHALSSSCTHTHCYVKHWVKKSNMDTIMI